MSGAARVLVVDDHELNLKLLQHVLEYEGHEVVVADSLAAAERAFAQAKPALIVLDVQLPDGDGLDLARRVKAMPQGESCAIVACTADAMKGDRERALAAGCDAYVSKPIDTRAFAALVASMLPSSSAVGPGSGHGGGPGTGPGSALGMNSGPGIGPGFGLGIRGGLGIGVT
jgi:two-component system, cell cycle response regulator DivK